MWWRRFQPMIVRVVFSDRIDIWRWDGRRQTLLFRGASEASAQPKLSRQHCKLRGRKFYLEEGMEPIEIRMDPEGDGKLILPREPECHPSNTSPSTAPPRGTRTH